MTLLRCLLALVMMTEAVRGDWRDDLSPPKPGAFPPLRAVKLEYDCGWAGIDAGHVEARFWHPAPDICELDGTAATKGLARLLWRLDAVHKARADSLTLEPLTVRQTETYRSQIVRTSLNFDATGVDRLRESTAEKNPARWKRFDFPNIRDLQTAVLYLRSQQLEPGKVYHLVVFPATTPYLAIVTVIDREQIAVKAGSYRAIRLDLRLEKVTGDMKLAPHGKFKRATAWLSDDVDRLPLRLNAQIFIGNVWAELARVN